VCAVQYLVPIILQILLPRFSDIFCRSWYPSCL